MLYLSRFAFPDDEKEFDFLLTVKRKCYNSFYPFKVLSARGLLELEMEPVTILYGGNGSGKTTALNVMAEALKLHRDSRYNRSSFFEDYIALCTHELRSEIPERSRVITSDDVFDFMLNLRAVNGRGGRKARGAVSGISGRQILGLSFPHHGRLRSAENGKYGPQ